MTTYDTQTLRCYCCGRTSEHSVLMSTNSFGSRDLDQRPPQMMRSTMASWLQECPSCGYVAADIKTGDAKVQSFVGTPAFQALCAASSPDPAVRRFMVRAVIETHNGDMESAFTHTLSAAWIADDRGRSSEAAALRLRAAAYIEGTAASLDTRLVLLDVLRRASNWEAAEALVDQLAAAKLEDPYAAIVSFHRSKIERRDSCCYTIADALADTPQPDNGGAANPERLKILTDHLRKISRKHSHDT